MGVLDPAERTLVVEDDEIIGELLVLCDPYVVSGQSLTVDGTAVRPRRTDDARRRTEQVNTEVTMSRSSRLASSIAGRAGRHVEPAIDYLSTVSGGGYIGCSVTALMGATGTFPFAAQRRTSTHRINPARVHWPIVTKTFPIANMRSDFLVKSTFRLFLGIEPSQKRNVKRFWKKPARSSLCRRETTPVRAHPRRVLTNPIEWFAPARISRRSWR